MRKSFLRQLIHTVIPLFFIYVKNAFTEYEEAAVELKDWGIPLIKVDGTREKELTDQVFLFQLVSKSNIKERILLK